MSARETAARLGRLPWLDRSSDTRGIFALAAMDHRDSLRIAFESAGFPAPPPERIAELKASVVRALAPHATGLLIDVELGAPAIAMGAPGPRGIVVPLEAQGYEDVAAGRVTTFLPGFSPALARTLGAAACKLLLPYRPDHEASAGRQDEVVREAVAGCHEEGLPMILEPIVYAHARGDARRLRRGLPVARGGLGAAPPGTRPGHPQGAVPAGRPRRRGRLVQATRRCLRADSVGAPGWWRRARGVRAGPCTIACAAGASAPSPDARSGPE